MKWWLASNRQNSDPMTKATPIYHGATPQDAKAVCVVVHGRGQTQDDMMRLIVGRVVVADVRYVLPKSEGPGWYAARAVDPLTSETLAEMNRGLDQIAAVIDAERKRNPSLPLLLCGFSQGACMAVEFLMQARAKVEAAALLTGCRVGGVEDDLPQTALDALPIYASCGDQDPWIPQSAYHRMLGDLTACGARIRTDMLPGRPHDVVRSEIAMLSGILNALANGAVPFDWSAQ
jgi:phospholipase/carboxylesterase